MSIHHVPTWKLIGSANQPMTIHCAPTSKFIGSSSQPMSTHHVPRRNSYIKGPQSTKNGTTKMEKCHVSKEFRRDVNCKDDLGTELGHTRYRQFFFWIGQNQCRAFMVTLDFKSRLTIKGVFWCQCLHGPTSGQLQRQQRQSALKGKSFKAQQRHHTKNEQSEATVAITVQIHTVVPGLGRNYFFHIVKKFQVNYFLGISIFPFKCLWQFQYAPVV